MTRRQPKPAPRTHEPAIEELIAVTQELLVMTRQMADGVHIEIPIRMRLDARTEAAIAAVRAPVAADPKLRTKGDGRKLAVRMLREIERADEPIKEGMDYDAFIVSQDETIVWRTDQQNNIVARYVEQARRTEAVLQGFGQVLTDYLLSVEIGCTPYLSKYGRPPRELSDAEVRA